MALYSVVHIDLEVRVKSRIMFVDKNLIRIGDKFPVHNFLFRAECYTYY